MVPEDLALLHGVADPQLSPDGRRVAYVLTRQDLEDDRVTSTVWLYDLDLDEARAFTSGLGDRAPRWSPDGSTIAFLRSPDEGEPSQLALVPVDGGEASVVTAHDGGVTELAWLPDGSGLVVVAVEHRGELAELDEDERDRRPRRITALRYRADDVGWTHDRVHRVWRVTPDGESTALTPADHDATGITVTPDGTSVLFLSPRQPDAELTWDDGVWRVPVVGGALEQLIAPGTWSRPAVDGDDVVLLGHADSLRWPAPVTLQRCSSSGELTQLDASRWWIDGTPTVLDDGSVLALAEDRGAVDLVRVAPDGGTTVVVGGAQAVTGWSASADGERVVYTATHPTDPGELWLLEGGEPRVLTAHNEELRERLLPVEHFTFERDGVEIDAWAVLPAGEGTVPLLVNIHGGPAGQYGHDFFDEFQVEAGAGFGVVGCNPRGSSGRGPDWARAVVGNWHDDDPVDILDLEALADAALARFPRLDPARLGIMGGSYGGYATARILTRTDRYRSAVVERGLLSWSSFGGTSDIGAFFDRMYLGLGLPEGLDRAIAASPVWRAGAIVTPTLVLHSMQDHRCPPEQALQMFSMLRRHGVESELLLFPDEGHELSRSGSPRHRVERFEAVLEWHGRHLR